MCLYICLYIFMHAYQACAYTVGLCYLQLMLHKLTMSTEFLQQKTQNKVPVSLLNQWKRNLVSYVFLFEFTLFNIAIHELTS
jgi:hypothetical protein